MTSPPRHLKWKPQHKFHLLGADMRYRQEIPLAAPDDVLFRPGCRVTEPRYSELSEMKLNSVPFGHLVRKFRSEEEMQRELEKPDGQLRRYDAQRLEPLLPPPKSQAPLGLTFVLPTHDRHLHDAVAWAGYWLKREFGYDWAPFQPEVWKEPGWREAFIYVADTQGGSSCRGCGRVPLGWNARIYLQCANSHSCGFTLISAAADSCQRVGRTSSRDGGHLSFSSLSVRV